MPLINLIQEQRLATKRAERKARAFFLGFACCTVASIGSYGFVAFQSETLEHQASKLRAERQRNEPLMKQIEENVKMYGELSPRLKTLEDAQAVSARWDRIMQHVAQNTPKATWLTALRVTATDPTKAINISLVGMAPAQEPIGEFILRMQNSADLESVNLKYSQEKLVQTTKAIEFEVTADIVGTADAKPKNEESPADGGKK
jgi:Tfp pilus assembly protein PilN